MHAASIRTATSIIAALVAHGTMAQSQARDSSWLDSTSPASWNTPGQAIPAAPKKESVADSRCRELARPPQLHEDERVRERGWDLIGAFQGGWDVLVIRGTASYDGMCRPLQYQSFVFVRGVFAGTLSPKPMDSRSDGALAFVSLQSRTQLTAEYSRYAESDALCCPSRRTAVVFEIATDPAIVRPISASTSHTTHDSADLSPNR